MIIIEAADATALFRAAADVVVQRGARSAPRGMATREVLGVHLRLTDPRARLVHIPGGRVLNTAFAVAEAMWILSGSDQPWIFDFNRNLCRYADDGVLRGAYGPRLRCWDGGVDQLDQVRRLLAADPDSRRAVVQLFDPARDHAGHRDVPCTLGYRFFIRDAALHMRTTMRSQDVWLGLPYDVFTATVLHELLAGWLGVGLGDYEHTVDSLHIYEQHWSGAAALPVTESPAAMDPVGVAWAELDATLAAVIAGTVAPSAGAQWSDMADVLISYRLWRDGRHREALALAAALPGVLGMGLTGWYETLTVRV